MNAAVITFPGSNCDQDCFHAVQLAGGTPQYRWHRDRELGDADLIVLPGGFAHGDYLRPGAIARFSPLMEDVIRFAESGRPVLGICNGFQMLCEAGLLPGALLRNRSLRFRSHDCWVRVENDQTIFTSEYERGQVLQMPLAHADGNYHASPETLARLEGEDRIVFRYVNPDGSLDERANPNGSAHNIAGILNQEGNVLGLMPHPDRALEEAIGSADGLDLFRSLVKNLTSPVRVAS